MRNPVRKQTDRRTFAGDYITPLGGRVNYDKNDFVSRLQLLDWNSVLESSDVNTAWNKFSTMFRNVIDKVAPVKEIRLKQRNKPWFSGEVRDMIQRRNQALLKFRRTKNNIDYLEFKRIRNQTHHKIQSYKKNYVLDQLEESQNNAKEL